jgi:maltooligosyltrehalose synthase
VDWDQRQHILAHLSPTQSLSVDEIVADDTGGTKLAVIARLLSLRGQLAELFQSGSYLALEVSAASGEPAPVLAYAREKEGDSVVVIVALRDQHASSTLTLPDELAGQTAENILSGRTLALSAEMSLSDFLGGQPFAVLRTRRKD